MAMSQRERSGRHRAGRGQPDRVRLLRVAAAVGGRRTNEVMKFKVNPRMGWRNDRGTVGNLFSNPHASPHPHRIRRSLVPRPQSRNFPVECFRHGWSADCDRDDTAGGVRSSRQYGRLELEIIAVIEALSRLRESPDYELCQLSERSPGFLSETAAERKTLLEKEIAGLEKQASQLAGEIRELSGETPGRIV